MKRRNADCGKLRKLPLKRNKISESIYSSTLVYMKFLLVWALVLLADFLLEFRFEYLWPFWLLMRSVYDSFKYQGLAFSVFFVCVTLTSDMVCYLFMPVHWLFFAASTYVWVQYVWHTAVPERGICLPTISLWLLFIYIEASVRLRELKSLPFHMDLCRPFASHCIGYPVVTLGFGFKSYVGYRMRQRRQRDIEKENEFYVQLIGQALPQDMQANGTAQPVANGNAVSDKSLNKFEAENGIVGGVPASSQPNGQVPALSASSSSASLNHVASAQPANHVSSNSSSSNSSSQHHNHNRSNSNSKKESGQAGSREGEYMESLPGKAAHNGLSGEGAAPEEQDKEISHKGSKSNGVGPRAVTNHLHENGHIQNQLIGDKKSNGSSRAGKDYNKENNNQKNNNINGMGAAPDPSVVLRLESEVKRLRGDLQSSRQCEQEMRQQLNTCANSERAAKAELGQLQRDNENLQTKLHNLMTSRQQDKQTVSGLEKRLAEEKKSRSTIESQLAQERKQRKADEQKMAALQAQLGQAQQQQLQQQQLNNSSTSRSSSATGECSEHCRQRTRELENESKQWRRDRKQTDEQLRNADRELHTLRKYKDSQSETVGLMTALSAMQDKNAYLENSLSAETRLKLDLFSALGEAKRQLEIRQALLAAREKEVDDLKQRIAEVMAVMPSFSSSGGGVNHHDGCQSPSQQSLRQQQQNQMYSSLDPNSPAYTPKMAAALGMD